MAMKKYVYPLLVVLGMVCAGSVLPEAYALELHRPCPSVSAHQTGPQWSPDGSFYAFNAENSKQSSIKICDIRNSREIEIFSSSGSGTAALLNDRNMQKNVTIVGFSWAPDSRHYAFLRSDKNDVSKNGIYIGSIEQKISAEDDPLIYDNSVASIAWVPLGEQGSGIIYMTGNDIKLVSLDRSYSVKKSGLIYSSENRKGSPVLSNDGRYLIWAEDTLNGPKLFKCDMDGAAKCRNRTRVTSDKTQYKELCPSVSPDNKYVAFYSNRDTTQDQEQGRIYSLWIASAEAGNSKKVSDHLVRGSASPVLCPSWSGNKIIYVTAETDETSSVSEAVILLKNNQIYAENRSLFRSVSAKGSAGGLHERGAVADLSVSPSSNTLAFSHQDFNNADGRFQMAWIDLNQALVDEKKQAESLQAERREAERVAAQRKEAERLEAERREAERVAAQRKEAEKLSAQLKEAERLEAQRRDAERLATQRKEAEKLAAQLKEAERLEAQRRDAERAATQREKAERVEAERREAERVATQRKGTAKLEVLSSETPKIVSQNTLPESKGIENAHIHYAGVIGKTSNFTNFTDDEKKEYEQGKASRVIGLNSKQELSETDSLLGRIAEFNYYRHSIKEGLDILVVRTDPPDFYLEEFRDASMIEDLYEALKKARISSTRPANSSAKSSIEWFNNLLEITDVYEKAAEKKKAELSNKAILSLAEKTNIARKKGFSELGSPEKLLVKRLNRMIFEELYAKETPKISERGYVNVIRDDNDPSVYYVRLYDKKKTGMNPLEITDAAGGSGIMSRLMSAISEKAKLDRQNNSIHFLVKREWEYFFNYKQSWFQSASSNETSMAGIVMISGIKDGVTVKAVPVKNSFRRKEEMPFAQEEVRGYIMDTPYEWRLQIKP